MREKRERRYQTPQKPYFEEPKPGAIVHFQTPAGRAPCGIRGAGQRRKSQQVGCVTCPACLKLMNLPVPSQQPPCGSPAGDTALSAELALSCAKKPVIVESPCRSPAPASAGAGLFWAEPGDENGS